MEATARGLAAGREIVVRNAVEGSKQKTSSTVRESDRARADLEVIKPRRELGELVRGGFSRAHHRRTWSALTPSSNVGRRLGDADGDGDGDGCRRTSAVVFPSASSASR